MPKNMQTTNSYLEERIDNLDSKVKNLEAVIDKIIAHIENENEDDK